eukprot:jgi/Tetstr1/431664/TSEL_021193.t1
MQHDGASSMRRCLSSMPRRTAVRLERLAITQTFKRPCVPAPATLRVELDCSRHRQPAKWRASCSAPGRRARSHPDSRAETDRYTMAAGQLLRPSLPRVDAGALTKPAQCRLACLGQRARRQHTSLAGRAAASSADLAAVTADEKAAPLGEPAEPSNGAGSSRANGAATAAANVEAPPAAVAAPGLDFIQPAGCGSSAAHVSALPFCLYFPAMDGQGLTASEQFPTLCTAFDVHQLRLAASNRSSYQELITLSAAYLEQALEDSPPERPVYLIGDSWGALLALGTALRCPDLVQRVALVSPVTTAPTAGWARLLDVAAPALALAGPLPEQLQRSLPLAFAPILGNPLRMAAGALDAASGLDGLRGAATAAATDLLGQLGALGEQLPPATLDWRLNVMRNAIKALNPKLSKVEQRVLVVVGDEDRLMPAVQEAERLGKRLQRAVTRVLPGSGHSLLRERGVNLLSIMEDEGFYVAERKFTSKPRSKRVGNNFGKAGPLELPTAKEVERTMERQYGTIGSLTSPVFFSEAEDGSIHQGLDHVNTESDRPILLIGNHQLLGLDMSFMISEFLQKKGRLMRGLTHPAIFLDAPQSAESDGGPMNGLRAQFTSYGAVPVGATTMYRLLQNGELVLLFPGGAREALKKRGEKYELIWPETAEFVRMAARTGAIIIPFGAVGSDESLNYILDSEEVMNNPVVMNQLFPDSDEMQRFMQQAQGRRGVNADAIEDYLVPPILAPGVPRRFYYLFRKPIVLEPEDAKDRDKCAAVYSSVKAEVEGGLAYLVRKRQNDPYENLLKRVVYEQLSQEQAPSFTP